MKEILEAVKGARGEIENETVEGIDAFSDEIKEVTIRALKALESVLKGGE